MSAFRFGVVPTRHRTRGSNVRSRGLAETAFGSRHLPLAYWRHFGDRDRTLICLESPAILRVTGSHSCWAAPGSSD